MHRVLRSLRFLPVLERELRIASRGKGLYRWRSAVIFAGLAVIAVVTGFMASANAPARDQGSTLFRTLLLLSGIYAVFAGVAVTADSISREKRDGTLGLLFLTDLRGSDIVLGKLAASSLNTVYGLVGLLPLLAIPVLLGGVSINYGIVATLGVLNLLFFSLAVGIWISALSWDERRSTFAALTMILVLCLGPLLFGGLLPWIFGGASILSSLGAWFSPLFPFFASFRVGPPTTWPPVLNVLPSHLLAWFLLLAAGRSITRSWQTRSGSPARRTVDEQLFNPRDPGIRSRQRRRMLDVHPMVWLLERHPGKRYYADGLVVAIMIIWAWGYQRYGSDMFGGPGWFLIVPLAFTIHLLLAAWMVAEASMRLLEDRRSGALELLMCTSLSDEDLISGLRLALRRLFLRPALLLAAVEVFIAFTGFGREGDEVSINGRWMMLGLAAAVLLDLHALSWISMRLAISRTTVNRVGLNAIALTPLGPALVTLVIGLWMSFTPILQPHVNFRTLLLVWLGCVVLANVGLGQFWARPWVLREFRATAARLQPRAAVEA